MELKKTQLFFFKNSTASSRTHGNIATGLHAMIALSPLTINLLIPLISA
jgi:hypothetical protein